MAQKMLIDATHPEETRVVVVDGQKVDDFDFESITKRQLAGNIYLAKVTRVEPSLQAAFVEYGGNRHGFLAFSEVHPDYYQIPIADREALLAEDAREEEERRAREEASEENGGGKSSSRSGRGRGRRKKDAKPEAEAVVSGLEVIDVVTNDTAGAAVNDGAPAGMTIAGVDEPAVEPLTGDVSVEGSVAPEAKVEAEAANEPVSPEPEEVTVTVPADGAPVADVPAESGAIAAAPEAEVVTVEGDAGNSEGEEIASAAPADAAQDAGEAADTSASDTSADPEAPDEPDGPPRSIAESAGLDDDDRVSEPVGEIDTPSADEGPARISDDAGIPDDASAQDEPAEDQAASEDVAPAPVADVARPEDLPTTPETEAEASSEPVSPETVDAPQTGDVDARDNAPDEAAPDEAAAPEAVETQTAETPDADTRPEKKTRRRRRARKSDEKTADAKETPKDTSKDRSKDTSDDSDEDASFDSEVESVGADDALEEVAQARTRLRRKYKIQDVIKVRQILLVQVVKEERGNKGAALTTYLSLAGRYCVLMPNTARGGGISRKITNASDRKRLREITSGLEVPQGMGLIVRTAGAERTKAEIKRDYEFLIRQWEQIRETTLSSVAPTLIYEEGSLIKRSIRDVYSKNIEQILVEGETGYREAKEYMKMLMPSHAKNVQPYTDPIPLFSRFQVESYLNGMFNPTVQLKSGGYIVIGVTEALVAIDVNSGRATKQGSIEETALQTNLEAADEVARQLRLRDLAGLIVIDFIDMDENRNNRAVEKRMKERLKSDRARIQVGRISAFGLMEMSRQRLRPGMLEATTQPCPHCLGVGLIRSDENLSLSILREVEEEGLRNRTDQVTVRAPVDVANYLINHKRPHIAAIEARHEITVVVLADQGLHSPNYVVERSKSAGRKVLKETAAAVTAETVITDEDLIEDAEVLDTGTDGGSEENGGKSRRRRGKRGGRRKRAGDQADDRTTDASEEQSADGAQGEDDSDKPRNRRGRGRRRGGRGRQGDETSDSAEAADAVEHTETTESLETAELSTEPSSQADAPATEGSANDDVSSAEPVAEETAAADDDNASEGSVEAGDQPDPEFQPDAEVAAADPAPAEAALNGADNAEAVSMADAGTAEAATGITAAPVAEETAVAIPEPAAEPEPPKKPKRRGWWSFGS